MAGLETRYPQYTAAPAADWQLARDEMDGEGQSKAAKKPICPYLRVLAAAKRRRQGL